MSGSSPLIEGQYAVDLTRPLPDAGGGSEAFAATDQRASRRALMAVRMARNAPANILSGQLPNDGIPGLLLPLAHGAGPPIGQEASYFVIAPEPEGAPLSANPRPWPEAALIEFVLRPVAQALEALRGRGLTHRGIRPNNVFQGGPNRPVTLGLSWATPPAMLQPAVFETPYTALCHPAGRGSGRIADDVYALGVLLVTLCLGRQPMEGLDDQAIIARKLDLGDFAAITLGERLPPMLTDILRGMLAEDPDHRPAPALLSDPVGARGRRVAARPPPRAQRPFRLGEQTAWNSRALAHAMAIDPGEAATAIETGTLTYWLRRGLGDAALAVRLEELIRQQAQEGARDGSEARAMLVMRSIVAADPLMPLCWGRLALFPDGMAPVMAAAMTGEPALAQPLREIVETEAGAAWAGMREQRASSAPHRLDARQRRALLVIKGPAGGLPRLAYLANPMLPCLAPSIRRHWIARPAALPAALDGILGTTPDSDILDPHIVAFIAARSDRWLDGEIRGLGAGGDAAEQALAAIGLFSALQQRFHPHPLPGLAAWAQARAEPLITRWRNKARRAAIEERVKTLSAEGMLPPILALLSDPAGRQADLEGLRAAVAQLASLDATLRAIADGAARRAAAAQRLGQEAAAGIGLLATAGTLILAALG
jgi:eukaryotic-like serine/threonine-protein kinase